MRTTLFARLLLLLCGISGFATGIALVVQDRFLARDLRIAAESRLDRAAVAANQLVDSYLEVKYAALARRARVAAAAEWVSLGAARPLEGLAAELLAESRARRVVLMDRGGQPLSGAGERELDALADDVRRAAATSRGDDAFSVISVPLVWAGEPVGRMVVIEPITGETLDQWSRLCGARVHLLRSGHESRSIHARVRELGGLELRVDTSLRPEQLALQRSRWALLLAGLAAIGIAFVASVFVSRSVAGPILRIKEVAQRIGQGDFGVRLRVQRDDEIGQVSAAINEMAVHLEDFAGNLRKTNQDLMALNTELSLAKERAEQASLAKTAFLANVSHEIRTPMTAILGYTDLLLEPERSSVDRTEWIETIRRNGDHLLSLINDILDLSKIEAGKLEIETRACAPAEIVRDVLALVSREALQKGLDLSVEFDGPVPAVIRSDPTRLRQVLVNLVANAIKFTAQGSVRVVVAFERTSPSRLRFDVQDTGIGIPKHKLESIFDPFSQADASMTRRYGGSGLGLTISRKLARILGGDLRVRSRPGRGSTFRLTVETGVLDGVELITELPETRVAGERGADRTCAPELPVPANPEVRGRALVAEDGHDNQRLIRAFLRKLGLEVDLVENGQLALEQAIEAERSERPYDVILMDMQMPVMDGYEATRRLRRAGYERPIIALTAHAMESDREKCLGAGCTDYTTKPFQRARLAELLSQYVSDKPA